MKHSYLEVKKGNLYSRTKEIGANKTSKNELWTMSRFWITVTNLSWVVWWQNNCWNLEENGQELIWVRQVNEIGTSYHSPVFIKRKKWMSHHEVRPAQSVSMASVLHCFFLSFCLKLIFQMIITLLLLIFGFWKKYPERVWFYYDKLNWNNSPLPQLHQDVNISSRGIEQIVWNCSLIWNFSWKSITNGNLVTNDLIFFHFPFIYYDSFLIIQWEIT